MTRAPDRTGTPAVRRWYRFSVLALLTALVVSVGFVAHYGVRAVAFPYALDYGEGPLLEQAMRLADGVGIYRQVGAEQWTVSNYPPLYPLLNSALPTVFGPAYWYGRAVSLLSAAGAGLFAGLIVRTITRDRLAAWATGLLIPAIPYVGVWSGLARIDLLALMLSLAGLWCAIRWPRSNGALVAAVALLAAAVYTRQTYLLAAPLTAFVWILGTSRRRAAVFAGSLAAVVLVVGLLLNGFTGGGFWFNVVTANVNQFDLSVLASYGLDVLTHLPVLVELIVVYVVVAVKTRPRSARVVLPYLSAAIVVGLTAGKIGSGPNYLLEFSVACSLAAGALLAWLRAQPRWHPVTMALLTVQALTFVVFPYPYYQLVSERMDDATAEQQLFRVVDGAAGPVLADEEMGMLPLVGRPIQLQSFELSQLARAGRWNQDPLLAAIRERRYTAILIYTVPANPVERERWTDEMLTAIDEAYAVDREILHTRGKTLVYRPRP